MNIVDHSIEDYIQALVRHEDPVLDEMERLAAAQSFPIVGRQVGRLLEVLTRATGARQVLELGSGFGYSAYWFSRAVGPDGRVILTDRSPERAELAAGFLERCGVADRVRIEVGDAFDVLERLDGPFDIIFNDVDKDRYPLVVERVPRVLRPGGLLISDNMLWFGKVLAETPEDPSTQGVQRLTRQLFDDPRFRSSLLPIRDGVSVSVYSG